MKPVSAKRCASATRCSPPPKPISSRRSLGLGIEEFADIGGRFAGDIECEMRQQVLYEVGLMRAKLVALAAAEERALPRVVVADRAVASG